MKKWMVLMLAVGFVLTASFSAQADVILPWIVKSPTVSTIVSVINTDKDPNTDPIHLKYFVKPGDTDYTSQCKEEDFYLPLSKNDIVVFDAANKINNGHPVYPDDRIANPKLQLGITSIDAGRGVLAIDGAAYAEAIVLELAGGAAWGYDAYDNSTATDQFGQIISPAEYAYLVIQPKNVFKTKLFVTPISANNQISGKESATVYLSMDQAGNQTGFYDQDENPYSTNVKITTTCTSALDIANYANPRLPSDDEAWAYVKVDSGRAAVGKLEYAISGTSIAGTTIPGATNNFIWLRSRK